MRLRNKGMALAGLLLMLMTGAAALATELVVDGDFEGQKNGDELRRDGKGSDWYESRQDGEGAGLLKLSTRDIAGNSTQKAVILADPELNTYLSHRFTVPQELTLTASFDMCIKEILPDDNRSAFILLGGIKDKQGGPNSTGKERFVFMGFENGDEPGTLNLFAREGQTKWAEKTVFVRGLKTDTWYTIKLELNVPEGFYSAWVEGVSEPFELESFFTRGRTPGKISHISFASWNDGAGTFYVDNVSVQDQ